VCPSAASEPYPLGRHLAHDCRLHMQRTTQRLLLQAATIDLAQAELTSLKAFGALINSTIPSGWPTGEYDRSAQESFLERLRQGSDQVVGWYSWYAIHTNGASRTLIGAGGFIGPPDDSGFVEIGFSILPDWYGRGFATEMAVELIAFAFEHDRVRGIIGNTTRSNVASCRVFSHLGFVETESDPNLEEVRFVLTKASAPA
jgi:ribosomal-protein-alanine N-acetyltransferase